MTDRKHPLHLDVESCVDHILREFGNDVRIGMPLGLGKPIPLINALYRRAKLDPDLRLTIFTALSLEKPTWSSELERRFLEPFVERVWGGVPDLDFMLDLRRGELPPNVRLHELFFKAGAYRNEPAVQQDYISSNYTHTVRDCAINDNAIFAHIVARGGNGAGTRYSASCNSDTVSETVRTFAADRAQGKRRLVIGMVNQELPYMYGEAERAPEDYDIIIDGEEGRYPLFSTPRLPVSDADYMIGLHVSSLVRDGGTLQIGIGALGDAIAYALDLRHNRNGTYAEVLRDAGIPSRHGRLIEEIGGIGPLTQGLYGSTEMLVDGFLQLYKRGVIRRRVYHHPGIQALDNAGAFADGIPPDVLDRLIDGDLIHPYLTRRDFDGLQRHGIFHDEVGYDDGHLVCGERRFAANLTDPQHRRGLAEHCLGTKLRNGIVLTGGFFIGPRDFYDTLREMPEEERRLFEMTGVEVSNQLYGDEALRALQRRDGRFCNTGMKATLLGHVVSDGLEDGWVVSGVGGQYNFVAMAHALRDGRLIMMIKSTRQEGGKTLSNILYNYGHITIPRHLRDIVVTEYGIADIRGRSDQEVIKAMLNVADSRFQEELLGEAKRHRKLPQDYRIPEEFTHNTPQRIGAVLQGFKAQGCFPPFPFGSEFTRPEMLLAHALKTLKAKSGKGHEEEIAAAVKSLPDTPPENCWPLMERMGVAAPANREERQLQKNVMLALRVAGLM